MDIDMTLDEIISKNKLRPGYKGWNRGKLERGTGFTGREPLLSQRSNQPNFLATGGTNRIILHNLSYLITDEDVSDLFSEYNFSKASVLYDQAGRSRGSAEIVFNQPEEAAAAYAKFSDVHLDGRPIRLEYVSRNSSFKSRGVHQNSNPRIRSNNRRSKGNRNEGVGKFQQNRKKPALTSEELDEQLENYRQAADGDI